MEWFVKWEFYFLRMRSGVLKYDEIFFTFSLPFHKKLKFRHIFHEKPL